MDARRELIQAMKSADSQGRDASVVVADGLRLRPICTETATQDDPDVILLTEGRNRFPSAFLTEFTATPTRTASWLRDVVTPNDGKVLFVLESDAGSVGYMGIDFVDWGANTGEIDAIVRTSELHPGAMTIGTKALIEWALGKLRLAEICVRVRSDNPALVFYLHLGFEEFKRVPLSKSEDPSEGILWTEDATMDGAELWLVHHRYKA